VKLLLIFINETDTWEDVPLDLALVQRLLKLHVAGATAHSGGPGFGRHMRVHHKGLFGISDDRPVTIMAVDEEEKIRAALPSVREMVKEGLILVLDAEVA
jgi:PII-like signaling protein